MGRWAWLVALLAIPFVVSGAPRACAEPTPPLRIGILDIRVIFNEYREIPAIEDQLKAEIARYESQVNSRRTRVNDLERAARAPGRRWSGSRTSSQDVTQARVALRETRRAGLEEVRLLEERATATVLAAIRRAAEGEAVVQELDLVLDRTDASMLFIRAGDPRVVDVTDAVLARMNTP